MKEKMFFLPTRKSDVEAKAIAAGGVTTLTAATYIESKTFEITVGSGEGIYTHNFILANSGRAKGDRFNLRFDLPESTNPRIDIVDQATGLSIISGAMLELSGLATIQLVTAYFDGSNWKFLGPI
jgi:hypothetical protein